MDILVTKRLTLRSPLDVDAEAICAVMQNKNITRMLTPVPNPYTLSDAQKWIDNASRNDAAYHFCIYREKLLGAVSVNPGVDGHFTLGYWLDESVWREGYMSEAARAAISHAFQKSGADEIYSGAYEDNPASMAVLVKLGFEAAETKTHYNPTRKCHVTCNHVVLTRARFESIFGSFEPSLAA